MPPLELWPPRSWAALLIGLMMLAYWFRVMQMVRRTRRTVGHHAHLVPPELLGRVIRVVWIPVVVLWIVHPLVNAVVAPPAAALRELFVHPVLHATAVAVAAAAFALTWVCWRNMGKSWRMGIDPNEKTELVFTGPFAYVRHPIYGLSQILMLTTVAAVPSPLMIALGVLHVLLMQWEVRREERYLVALHGPAYSAYQANVGRFFPRSLHAYRPAPSATAAGPAARAR